MESNQFVLIIVHVYVCLCTMHPVSSDPFHVPIYCAAQRAMYTCTCESCRERNGRDKKKTKPVETVNVFLMPFWHHICRTGTKAASSIQHTACTAACIKCSSQNDNMSSGGFRIRTCTIAIMSARARQRYSIMPTSSWPQMKEYSSYVCCKQIPTQRYCWAVARRRLSAETLVK